MAIKNQVVEKHYTLWNGDCIEAMRNMPDECVDLSIYSPPFCGLYNYSSHEKDLSNCRSYAEFIEHYGFVVAEKARITKPGRISCVHCMDVPKDGANLCGYIDFPGDIIRLHEQHGFEYSPRICIWKEPLGVRNRTMAKALTHRQVVEDSTLTNVAAGDYLIPFRKKGANKVPVTHNEGLMRYAGERVIPHELAQYKGWTGSQIENRYSHWIWRQYASCFWDDIRLDEVVEWEGAKDPQDERHPHPLQLDVIERCAVMYSNPGEIIFTPFMGVGSEVVGALVNGRRGIGVELKEVYYNQAVKNVAAAQFPKSEQADLLPA